MSKPEVVAQSIEPIVNPRQTSRMRLLGAAAFVVALALVFGRSLYELAIYVSGTELHSHILLVPLISAYLLHIRWRELPKDFSVAPLLGGIALAVAAAAWWTDRSLVSSGAPISQNDHLALIAFAFVCAVAAGGFLFLGRRWMWAAAFPMFFLLFLVPLPDAASEALETASKYASAEAANLFFNLSGVPFLRHGLVFQLPSITLQVAQECSGIRSSWVLVITSLLAANLFLRTTWRRAMLVLFVIPLGILRNGFRILVIGLLCVHIGPEMIHGLIHRRGGPLFFALSLIPLFALLWWLRRGEAAKGIDRSPAENRPDREKSET